jgi:hypothetical protein
MDLHRAARAVVAAVALAARHARRPGAGRRQAGRTAPSPPPLTSGFGVLGPVEVVVAGGRTAGRPVSVNRLIDVVWGDNPSASARVATHARVQPGCGITWLAAANSATTRWSGVWLVPPSWSSWVAWSWSSWAGPSWWSVGASSWWFAAQPRREVPAEAHRQHVGVVHQCPSRSATQGSGRPEIGRPEPHVRRESQIGTMLLSLQGSHIQTCWRSGST